jgi:hypothetical protein
MRIKDRTTRRSLLGVCFDTQIIDSSHVMGVLRNNRGYRNALMLKELE